MNPTIKAPAIENLLTEMNGGLSRQAASNKKMCVMCRGDASSFRDALSQREYCISGMCQKCQDRVFGS